MPLAAVDRPFTDHAVAHLLVGMIVPLLLVLAAPLTLALRSFAPLPARRLSRALRSMPVRVIAHPVIAALLSVGSLWLLCTTPLYADTAEPLPHLIVMTHFLLSGFLFTAVIAPVDPSPHRSPVGVRLVVLTLALAAHGVLAKALYASASGGTGMLAGLMQVGGVSPVDLQTGAQVMFYGGDLVDLALIVLVLWGWYRAVGRQRARISARTASAVPATASASVPLPQEQRA
jgi:putative membrane protein